uniref:Uncharacterized protein n=1 Tax=Anguilla anguilla TaxID=7936 RepID=A0A0E9XVW1_ANGAN
MALKLHFWKRSYVVLCAVRFSRTLSLGVQSQFL